MSISLKSFDVLQGEKFSKDLTVYSDAGVKIDLTDAVITCYSQHEGTEEESTGSGDMIKFTVYDPTNGGVRFYLDAADTADIDTGIYTHSVVVATTSLTQTIAKFQLIIYEQEDMYLPISKTNILLRMNLTPQDVNASMLQTCVDDSRAIVRTIIPSDVFQHSRKYGYPQHVTALAEMYATEMLKSIVYPEKESEADERRLKIESLIKNVSIDTDEDEIPDKGTAGTFDIIMS